MNRKIKWLPKAATLLENIYDFYATKSERYATKLYNNILDAAEPLHCFPEIGQQEPALCDFKAGFRYLIVEHHFKLIYSFDDTTVEIHAIWDCRKNPKLLSGIFKQDSEI